MIRNTKNFNLKKPEQGDFYNVDDFNDNSDIIDAELENRKKAQEDDEKNIKGLTNPEYDDSGTVSGIDSFPAFLNKTKSKMNIFQWYRDFKAGMQFVLHAGQIVNNCVSSDADKPLAAAQGKALQDQLTKLYSDLGYYITSVDDFSHTLIGEVRKNITLNSKITLGQYTRVLFMNILNSKDGALLAIAPGDKIITAFRNNGVWEEKSSHFIATKSDLANKTKSGSATISTKQNDSTALQIRFDEPFPSRPYVTVSLNTDNANTNTKISVFGIDQTGFKVSIYDTAATTRRIEWIASV